jgi:hypothetical protein
MYSLQFVQGAVWTCFLLGAWNFVVRPNLKPALFIKLLNVVADTLKSSKNKLIMKQDGHMLRIENNTDIIHLPTFEPAHMIDVVCYQDEGYVNKIPITLFQFKNQYAYVPFKPSNLSLTRLYVGIKYLTRDEYKFFEVQANDFVDIPSLLRSYDTQINTEPTELAEAYDE